MEKEELIIRDDVPDFENYEMPMERDPALNKLFKKPLQYADEILYALEEVRGSPEEAIVRNYYRILKTTTDPNVSISTKTSLKPFQPSKEVKIAITRKAFSYHCERAGNPIGVFNGKYVIYDFKRWKVLEDVELATAFSKYACKSNFGGSYPFTNKCKEIFLKDFHMSAVLPQKPPDDNVQLINMNNCTLHIVNGEVEVHNHSPNDRLCYVLDYDYDPLAEAPLFTKFLEVALPEENARLIFYEYLGYIFSKGLNLEKCLLLVGPGGTGKSTVFNIVTALVGKENVSYFDIDALSDQNGYARLAVGGKLLNYSSEMATKHVNNYDRWKQFCSREPMQARGPYRDWVSITDVPALIFNINDMPANLEPTRAFYRRLIPLPFNTVVKKEDMDIHLASKTIKTELSGILNLAIKGLQRIIANEHFTESELVQNKLEEIQKETNSVAVYMSENNFYPPHKGVGAIITKSKKELFDGYVAFCQENKFAHCNSNSFSKRLVELGFPRKRASQGYAGFEMTHTDAEIVTEETDLSWIDEMLNANKKS